MNKHMIKDANGKDWQIEGQILESQHTCIICDKPHNLAYFKKSNGQISYYYCQVQQKWVNEIPFEEK